jgi:hypothetical protein
MQLHENLHPEDLQRVLTELVNARAEAARGEHAWHRVRFRQARRDAAWADVEALFTGRGRLLFGIRRVRVVFACVGSASVLSRPTRARFARRTPRARVNRSAR